MGINKIMLPRTAAIWALALASASPVLALDPTLPRPGGRTPAVTPNVPSSPTLPPTAPSAPLATPPAAPPRTAPSTTPAAAGADVAPAPPASRPAVPDAAAIGQANRLIDQLYKDRVAAAKTPELKKQLGQQFLKIAYETTSDPAGKYVLLQRARDIAADSGDVDTTLAAVAETEKCYNVESGNADLEVIGRLQKSIRGPEPHRGLARYLLGSANDALAADRFEAAKKLVDSAVASANRANEPPLAKLANSRAKEVREVESAYIAAKPAMAAVTAGKADADQSLTAGRYKCLYKGDWTAGLPMLAAGTDPALKDLASKELATPAGADNQLAVADAWWTEAEALAGVPKNLATVRARYWYEQAEPYLTGLQKVKAQKRLKESESLALLYGPKGVPTAAPQAVAVTPVVPAAGSGDSGTASTGPVKLPPKFTREWKSPAVWINKPELVTIKEGKVNILNEGGTNPVCTDAEFTVQKDGSLVLQWSYGENKTGYEIWLMQGKDVVIQRWNSKEEKDSGKQARRIGFISGN